MIQQRPPMQPPQVPPQMARTPQFGAAKQVVMEGLPQLFEDLVTLKAVELVNSADRQEAMEGDPGENNMQVAEGSIKSQAQQGIMNALAGMQRPQQPPMPQQAMGLPQLPANNMAMLRAAQGGIVGFAGKGPSLVEEPDVTTVEQQRKRYLMLKDLEAKYMAEGNQEALNNVRRELENYEGSIAAEPPKPTPENTFQMAGGGIVAFREGGFPDLSGDGKVTQKDILMGRGVVNKAHGGVVALDEGGFLDTITGGIGDLATYVTENPLEAAGYASLLVPGGAGLQLAGRGGLAALRYLAPKALAGLKTTGQALKTGATQAGKFATTRPIKSGYGSAVRGPQGRFMSADAAKKAGLDLNRTFSPVRTGAIAGPALLGTDYLLDGDDATEEEIIQEVVNTPEGTIEDTFASAMEQAGSTQETIDAAQDRLGEQIGIREEAETQVSREGNFFEVAEDLKQTDPESSIFDKKLEEIMKRSKSPIRTISTFLQGYGEGKFTGASKAMRAAEAQYDNMEMDLLKLQQANRISQQQFDLNKQKIANEKEQLRIMEDNYKRTADVRSAYNDILSTYYDDMIKAQRSRDTASLISTRAEIAADFRGNPILHEDVIRQVAQQQAGGGLNTRQLDKYIEQQGGNSAFMEAAESAFINQLFPGLSGLGGSVGAGTNINTALPEGVTVTRQD